MLQFIDGTTSPQVQVYKKKWGELHLDTTIPKPSENEFRNYMHGHEESQVRAESYALRYRSEIDGKIYRVPLESKAHKWSTIIALFLIAIILAHAFTPIPEPKGNWLAPREEIK